MRTASRADCDGPRAADMRDRSRPPWPPTAKSRGAGRPASPSIVPAEPLHPEHLAAALAEGDGGLLRQDLEQPRVLAGNLRAHRVGRDLQLRIGVEAIDERLD